MRKPKRVPDSYLWIDGIEYGGPGNTHLCIVRRYKGQYVVDRLSFRSAGRLNAISASARPTSGVNGAAEIVLIDDLSAGEALLLPQELICSVVTDLPATAHHAVFKFKRYPTVYIPAILLIQMLYMGVTRIRSHLLVPGGVDLLGVARTIDNRIEVNVFSSGRPMPNSGRTARLLAWLLTQRDARVSFASVLDAAKKGNISLRLPRLSLKCWVHGLQFEHGLLVKEIWAEDIRYPLVADEIVLTTGNQTQSYSCYEPPPPSPLKSKRQFSDASWGYEDPDDAEEYTEQL